VRRRGAYYREQTFTPHWAGRKWQLVLQRNMQREDWRMGYKRRHFLRPHHCSIRWEVQ